jgi:hypothetical protein
MHAAVLSPLSLSRGLCKWHPITIQAENGRQSE